MIKAVAFDPGKTTGFATGEIDVISHGGREVGKTARLASGNLGVLLVQTAQAELTHTDLFEFITDFKPNYIICERFDFRMKARTGLELVSRELIGVINLYIGLNKTCTLVMQTPGQAIGGYWSNAKLLKYHLYRKGQDHANDACRHLMYWYKFGSGHQFGTEFKHKND